MRMKRNEERGELQMGATGMLVVSDEDVGEACYGVDSQWCI